VLLIAILLLDIKDDCASDEGREHVQFVLHLLIFCAKLFPLLVLLLVAQFVGVELLAAHLLSLPH
jgi:hypothetical protein